MIEKIAPLLGALQVPIIIKHIFNARGYKRKQVIEENQRRVEKMTDVIVLLNDSAPETYSEVELKIKLLLDPYGMCHEEKILLDGHIWAQLEKVHEISKKQSPLEFEKQKNILIKCLLMWLKHQHEEMDKSLHFNIVGWTYMVLMILEIALCIYFSYITDKEFMGQGASFLILTFVGVPMLGPIFVKDIKENVKWSKRQKRLCQISLCILGTVVTLLTTGYYFKNMKQDMLQSVFFTVFTLIAALLYIITKSLLDKTQTDIYKENVEKIS